MRRTTKAKLLTAVAGAWLGLMTPASAAEQRVFSTRSIERSLPVEPSNACRLIVDNVWGDIRVSGQAAGSVAVEAVETVRADSATAAERAAREVKLDLSSRDGAYLLLVDGPFRDRRDRRRWADGHRHPGYIVAYDIAVRVPGDCDLDLRTVNEGEIEVAGIAGELQLRNVNGGIRLDRVAGRGGEVATVNGPIVASFVEAPTARLSFRSVNGTIEVSFPPRLSADLDFESAWGEIWSEFELAPRPAPPAERRSENGRLVIQTGRRAALRAGAGGPEISFKTLNGDILIRKEG